MTDDDVIRLARDLPHTPAPEDVVEQMRTAVLSSMPRPAARGRSRRTRWLVGAVVTATAAAAAVAIWIGRANDDRVPASHASVTAIGEARFARIADAPDEVLRLTDGLIHVEVTPLGVGERFRIRTGDGEVEVRGTAFDVEAHANHLQHVVVTHGRVEVRTHGVVAILGAGEQWTAPTIAAIVPPEASQAQATVPPAASPLRPPVVSTTPRAPLVRETAPSVVAGPTIEETFRAGWEALQAGNAATAAEAFDRVATLAPHDALAEDAEFWRATALARARKPAAARDAYARFLSDFPRSVRAGEVAVLLGYSLLEANDVSGATAAFIRAKSDPVARVRESAEAGLAELSRRRDR